MKKKSGLIEFGDLFKYRLTPRELVLAVRLLTPLQVKALDIMWYKGDEWVWPADYNMYGAPFAALERRGLAEGHFFKTKQYRLSAPLRAQVKKES